MQAGSVVTTKRLIAKLTEKKTSAFADLCRSSRHTKQGADAAGRFARFSGPTCGDRARMGRIDVVRVHAPGPPPYVHSLVAKLG